MRPQHIPEQKWAQWKRKRKSTLIGYILVGAMVGLDYSFMFTTLYLYLKDMIKTQHPDLFYGIIIAVYSLSSTITGAVCGRWVDRTRKIKMYTILVLTVQIVGCLLYVVHFNVAYPLIGRMIGGLGDPFPSVTSGEIVRIYDTDGSTRALWWLASIYSIGSMVGPVLVKFFKHVDFYIWSIHVTQLNVIAIFMAGLLLITLFLVQYFIHDCSAEIDLKKYLHANDCKPNERRRKDCSSTVAPETQTEGNEPVRTKVDEEISSIPIRVIFKFLSHNVDAMLMFIATFSFMYCLFSSDVLLPLISLKLLQWPLDYLTYILVGNGILYFVLLMIMSKLCTSDRGVYNMAVFCILTQVFMFATMIIMHICNRNHTRDIVLMVLFVIFWVFAWIIEEVIMRCMLAKMVPSSTQSFVETLRNGVSRVSTVLASITAPLAMGCLQWWSAALIVVIVVLLLGFLVRRKQLCRIEQMEFDMNGNVSGKKVCIDGEGPDELRGNSCHSNVNEGFGSQ